MSNTTHVETGFAELNGTTLYYEVAGAGHPFVLVHGHLLDRSSWDEQFAVFAQRYRVIRYDQRGFGDSGLITKGEPYSDRQDLYELMKFLGIESAYLMGVSGGGALAIDFTLEHPEMVDALIPVTAGVSGFRPSEDVMKKHPEVVRIAQWEKGCQRAQQARTYWQTCGCHRRCCARRKVRVSPV